MNKLLSEILKVSTGISPVSIGHGTIALSRLIPLGGKQRKALFAVIISSADVTGARRIDMGIVDNTVACPAATTDLAARAAAGETLVYEDINGLATKCGAMRVNVAGVGAGAITINGTAFPYAAVPATPFEWSNDATFAAVVNAAGLGLTAAAIGGNVVTVVSTIPAEQTITMTSTIAGITTANMIVNRIAAYLEIDASQLNPGATGVYAVVDHRAGAGTVIVSSALIRGHGRYTPEQAVAVPE